MQAEMTQAEIILCKVGSALPFEKRLQRSIDVEVWSRSEVGWQDGQSKMSSTGPIADQEQERLALFMDL
jgi:hypothetical protein